MKLLPNTHISPESAYIVDDYPFGFKLRCKKRFWLDCNEKRGARCMTQTTNPKRPGEVWNKPKASTYYKFAGAMYLDDEDHVQFVGLHEYTNWAEATIFRDKYGPAVPELLQPTMNAWIAAKAAYEATRDAGGDLKASSAAGAIAFAKTIKR